MLMCWFPAQTRAWSAFARLSAMVDQTCRYYGVISILTRPLSGRYATYRLPAPCRERVMTLGLCRFVPQSLSGCRGF